MSKKKLSTFFIIAIILFIIMLAIIIYLVTKKSSSPGPSPNPPYEWLPIKSMPVARDFHASVSTNGTVFVIGGAGNARTAIASVEGYTPATSGSPATWTEMASMPTARYALAAVALGKEYIYALGGQRVTSTMPTGLDIVEVFNVKTGEWTTGNHMNTVRDSFGAGVVNGKIVAVGGDNGTFGSSVEIFDPVTKVWTNAASMTTMRSGHCVAVLGNMVYAMGGGSGTSTALASVERYDITTNKWTNIAPMNTARSNFAAATVAGKLYVMGGVAKLGGPSSLLKSVELYDPATMKWTNIASMTTPREAGAATTLNDSIYVTGGTNAAHYGGLLLVLKSAEVFSVPSISTERHY